MSGWATNLKNLRQLDSTSTNRDKNEECLNPPLPKTWILTLEWRRGSIHSTRKFETVLETVWKNHAPMTLRFNLKDPLLLYTSIMISNRDGLQLLRLFNKKDGACFMNHPLQSKEVELFGDKKWFHVHIDWNSMKFFQIPMSELFLFQAGGNVSTHMQWCNATEWFSAKLSGWRFPTWCFNHSSSESKDVYNFDYQLLSLL